MFGVGLHYGMRLPEAQRMTFPASVEEELSPSDTSASLPLYLTPPVPAPPWLSPPSNSEQTQVNVSAPVPIPTLVVNYSSTFMMYFLYLAQVFKWT